MASLRDAGTQALGEIGGREAHKGSAHGELERLAQFFPDGTRIKVPVEIEVYPQSQHGWCVPDMPKQANGEPIYNKPDAERAWSKLVALYKAALA